MQLFPRFFKKPLQQYRHHTSIEHVLSRTFTISSTFGMLFLGMILLFGFYRSTIMLTHQRNQEIVSQVELNAAYYLDQVADLSDTLLQQMSTLDTLHYGAGQKSLDLIYTMRNDVVLSISIFDARGRLLTAVPNSKTALTSNPSHTTWFTNTLAQPDQFHYTSAHANTIFKDSRTSQAISISRAVTIQDGSQAIICVELDYANVAELCISPSILDSMYLYLVDADGTLLYHPDMVHILDNIELSDHTALVDFDSGHYPYLNWYDSFEISVSDIPDTTWRIITITPLHEVIGSFATLFFSLAIIIVSAICLMIYINRRLSELVSEPIKALDHAVQGLSSNHALALTIPVEGSLEVQRLGASIQSMVNTLHSLMDDLLQQEEMRRRTDLEVLHSQINPHFLYNTLDSIVRMIEMERNHDAATMITSLARLFRISLSKGRNIIALQSEFDHAKHYLTIQKIRYQDGFTATVDLDDNLSDCYTSKLVIQPILENAIYYGMAHTDEDGKITVKGTRQGDRVVISISDNGPGMSPETVASLLDLNVPPKSSVGSGIGLKNVHQRLALTFGPEYGLSIESEPDEGTTVHIHLPIVSQEMADKLDFQ